MTTIRAVSLDFDDTLVESEAMKRRVLEDVARSCGALDALATVDTDARVANKKVTRHTIFRDLCAAAPSAAAVGAEALVRQFSDRCQTGIATAAEVPGASRLLRYLRDHGVPVFINSATPEDALRRAARVVPRRA